MSRSCKLTQSSIQAHRLYLVTSARSPPFVRYMPSIREHPSSFLMSGFSCQPYSSGGSQRGVSDQRSGTLHSTPRAGFMMRNPAIILECVQEASNNSMVCRHLESFRDQCGFHLSEVMLRLEDAWISKRARWWAILMAPFVGCVQVGTPGHLDSPNLQGDLLPRPLTLSSASLHRPWHVCFCPKPQGTDSTAQLGKSGTGLSVWL